ncbi:MAG: hypothetical protein J6K32_04520 [Clostridia bacterium]|nr:hypothetical protein [Clostridia bacterium]
MHSTEKNNKRPNTYHSIRSKAHPESTTNQGSKEELVAELGASALISYCGLETSSSFRNNAAYIQNWLQALRNDKRLIVSASGKAEKAVDLMLDS